MTLSQQQAEELLDPFRPLLLSSLRGAVQDWSDLLGLPGSTSLTAGLSTRTQSGYVHDRVVYRLQQAHADGAHPGFRMAKVKGLWVGIINDQMVLKFKKLDKKFRSRNIATLQTRMFDGQAALMGTPPAATNATSGYVADRVSGAALDFVVVCWNGVARHWYIPLDRSAGGEGGGESGRPIVPIVAGPIGPTVRRKRTRVVEPIKKTGDESAE